MTQLLHVPFWLGDFVMAQPFAHRWSRHFKDEKKIVVVDPSLEKLFERSGLDTEVWVLGKKDRGELTRRLKAEKPEGAWVMTNSLGSILPYWKAGVPRRYGFGGNWTKYLLTDRADPSLLSLPQGDRWMKAFDLGFEGETPRWLELDRSDEHPPHLLVFPGAKYGPSKQWDPEAYAGVIEKALEQGWKVTLVGSPDEKEDARAIQTHLEHPVDDWCGQYRLHELLDAISDLKRPLALANDSGAMHLMAACGLPTLGLYFSTAASNTPPAFGEVKLMEAEIECRPCYARTCPKGHYDCRKRLGVDAVFLELSSLA